MLQIEMTNEQWMDGVIERKFNKDYPAQDVERIAKIRDQIAAMTQRAERAEAVVEKLPVTADGVRVVPNMKVWFAYTDGSGVCNDFAPDMEMMDGEWSLYYSTPEAAQAAIDAKGGK